MGGGCWDREPLHLPSASFPFMCDIVLTELSRTSGKIRIAHHLLGRHHHVVKVSEKRGPSWRQVEARAAGQGELL